MITSVINAILQDLISKIYHLSNCSSIFFFFILKAVLSIKPNPIISSLSFSLVSSVHVLSTNQHQIMSGHLLPSCFNEILLIKQHEIWVYSSNIISFLRKNINQAKIFRHLLQSRRQNESIYFFVYRKALDIEELS